MISHPMLVWSEWPESCTTPAATFLQCYAFCVQEGSAATRRHEKVQICKSLPHQKVVQPPAFVAGSGVETVVPVGVACDLRVLPPPCICEASAYQQLTERVPLLLQHHYTCTALCKKIPLLNWRQATQSVSCRCAATGNNHACVMALCDFALRSLAGLATHSQPCVS